MALAVWVASIVVLPILAQALYVVCRSKPGWFKLAATLFKVVSINVEVDAQENAGRAGPCQPLQSSRLVATSATEPTTV